MPALHQTQPAIRSSVLLLTGATVIMLFALQFQRIPLFSHPFGAHVILHLLLELVSIFVSAMVVSVAWMSKETERTSQSPALVYGFSLVAGFDLLHAITFRGMPQFINPANSNESIFFWLAGRIATIITIVIVALPLQVPGKKRTWFFAAIATLLFFLYIASEHLNALPTFYVSGEGVTPIKAGIEYAIFTMGAIAAGWLYYRGNNNKSPKDIWLATACGMMGLSELAFTGYLNSSEFLNIFGHVYKIISYALIFRVIVFRSIQAPYEALAISGEKLEHQKAELQNLIENLPIDVLRLDAGNHIKFISKLFASRLGINEKQPTDLPWQKFIPEGWREDPRLTFTEPQKGQKITFDFVDDRASEKSVLYRAIAIPNMSREGGQNGVLALFIDITAQEAVKEKLVESEKENNELRSALDAHAIVAVTNARGIITNVNEKFCQISKFSRDELIGKTHSIINSGHHPASFFHNLWKTISSGQIWNGEICNRAKDGTLYWVFTTIVPFVDQHGKPIQYIAIRADITEQKRAEQSARHMALYDVLTDLPNRRLMNDRLNISLNVAKESNQFGALLLLDLDHFKEVNDTLGHDQGDNLLRQVAKRLANCVGHADTVARMGGDEFVIILNGLDSDYLNAIQVADRVCENIQDQLTAPYVLKNTTTFNSCSIGIVLFKGEADSGDDLLKRADMALYRAKAEGRSRFQYFDPSLEKEIIEQAQILKDLRKAEERGELVLFYQPIVNLRREISGYEALIRWQHPTHGLLSPAKFITVAEKSGLILPIGEWVFRQACKQLAQWGSSPDKDKLTIAVNVSAVQFRDELFSDKVRACVELTGVNPSRLRLEITESMLQSDITDTIKKMSDLREIGIQFSLDDFGTGYSSLSYLKRMPIDVLKIDRSFVQDVMVDADDAAIAETILLLAKTLDLTVIAEGVETVDQFDFLRERGCEMFQGYLFGKPEPITQ